MSETYPEQPPPPPYEPPPLEESAARLSPAAHAAIAAAVLLALTDRPDLPGLPWMEAAILLGVPTTGAVLEVARAAAQGDPAAAARGAYAGARRMVQMAQGAASRALADPDAPGDPAGVPRRDLAARYGQPDLAARAAANTARNQASLAASPHTHKTWVSMNDSRVRPTHAVMDSHAWPEHTVPIHEPFVSPSGASLMFPGDPAAPLAETANCRCHLRFTTPKRGQSYGEAADLATNPPQMHGTR